MPLFTINVNTPPVRTRELEMMESKESKTVEPHHHTPSSVETCTICYKDFEPADTVRTPCCHHTYCRPCLRHWVNYVEQQHHESMESVKADCPTCRGCLDCIKPELFPSRMEVVMNMLKAFACLRSIKCCCC